MIYDIYNNYDNYIYIYIFIIFIYIYIYIYIYIKNLFETFLKLSLSHFSTQQPTLGHF